MEKEVHYTEGDQLPSPRMPCVAGHIGSLYYENLPLPQSGACVTKDATRCGFICDVFGLPIVISHRWGRNEKFSVTEMTSNYYNISLHYICKASSHSVF